MKTGSKIEIKRSKKSGKVYTRKYVLKIESILKIERSDIFDCVVCWYDSLYYGL